MTFTKTNKGSISIFAYELLPFKIALWTKKKQKKTKKKKTKKKTNIYAFVLHLADRRIKML